jgi:peroxiredoxin
MRSVARAFSLILVVAIAAYGAEPPKDGGIGVVLGTEGQNIVVIKILPDSPAAAQHDLRVGDRILAVAQENEPAVRVRSGMLAQTIPLIRGPQGTTVRLTIVSSGEDESRARVMSFVRGEVKALSDWGNGTLLEKGTKAPDIEMVELTHGKSERLTDYAGRIIVLEFWATWCGPCQPKVADLQRYSETNTGWKDKVVLIAASVDDAQAAPAKHLEAKGWLRTHNVWVGVDARKAYHISAIPTAYVIGRQGQIVAANPHDLPQVVNQQLQARPISPDKRAMLVNQIAAQDIP